MSTFLGGIADRVARRPGISLVVLAIVTAVLGFFASQQTTETDLTAFAGQTELAETLDDIQQDFGAGGSSMQVIVDAGQDGDVLSPEGLAAAGRAVAIAQQTEQLQQVLAETATSPPVVSFADPLRAAFTQQNVDPAQADEATVDRIASAVLTDGRAGQQASALLSQDVDPAAASAEAGLVIVQFAADAEPSAVADGETAFAEAVREADVPGDIELRPFGQNVLSEQLTEDMNEELPFLLGISLLLIVGILLFTYRRISDVAIGFVGLIATIVWMYGIGVLLGPDYAGLTGPFSQIAIVVPVLLVGLGIDYAIHLTSRYREQQSKGDEPPAAARTAMVTVGGALVLATATTLAGFLTNVVSPLPPIRDFGIFVAGGVVSAFVVFAAGVPAARSLLDGRGGDGRTARARPEGQPTGLSATIGRASVLSERVPKTTLAVALVVTALGVAGGTQVSTTFNQEDFVPEDSEIGTLFDRFETLFGGAVDERTYVELRGDLTDPAVANAILAAQANMVDTEGVRTAGGQAQASSPAAAIATAGARSPQLAQQLRPLGWTGQGFAPDAELEAMYGLLRQTAPAAVNQVMADDNQRGIISVATSAGQEGADELRQALREDIAPLADTGIETTIVSEPLVLDQTLQQLTDSQTRSIVITLVVALALLVAYYGLSDRRPVLGAVTMVPSVLVVAWVLGSMWVLGLSFNVLTATVASLAIGIGVPYGIHVTHRFIEDRRRFADVDDAIRDTVTHTGGALAGSAATTAAGFGVLGFASLAPIQQFGVITALTIVYSLTAAVLVQPACLKLWTRWRDPDGAAPSGRAKAAGAGAPVGAAATPGSGPRAVSPDGSGRSAGGSAGGSSGPAGAVSLDR